MAAASTWSSRTMRTKSPSRAAPTAPIVMAQVWMHNGFLQVEGEKMSKILGNFVTVQELLTGWQGYAWPGEALRFNMFRTHYRQPLDWTLVSLDEAHKTLVGLVWRCRSSGAGVRGSGRDCGGAVGRSQYA